MKAMARLIDAGIALENIDEWLDTVGTALIGRGLSYYAELQGCIEDAPTVDAVPVVHCKDCERWQRHTQVNCDYGECRRFSATTKNDDFCSRGERRG